MYGSSAFIDLAAVEAWDACFRWRQGGDLRDISIQDTWGRVAHALARAEPRVRAGTFETHLFEAMEAWRLLLDERLLATAGTDVPHWPDNELVAVVNPASMVREAGQKTAWLDQGIIESTAELAVIALDNAAQLALKPSGRPAMRMRVGMVGLADAIALLGHRYDSPSARRVAENVARSLACGCLRGSIRLARERGAHRTLTEEPALAHKLREISAAMAEEAARYGLRHSRVTAITSQPRLALLANQVADAVDPLLSTDDQGAGERESPARPGCSAGFAFETLRRQGLTSAQLASSRDDAAASREAQLLLRAAMQRWIDQPIHYPLRGEATRPARDALAATLRKKIAPLKPGQ